MWTCQKSGVKMNWIGFECFWSDDSAVDIMHRSPLILLYILLENLKALAGERAWCRHNPPSQRARCCGCCREDAPAQRLCPPCHVRWRMFVPLGFWLGSSLCSYGTEYGFLETLFHTAVGVLVIHPKFHSTVRGKSRLLRILLWIPLSFPSPVLQFPSQSK